MSRADDLPALAGGPSLARLDSRDAVAVDAVARLHETHLPDSPIVRIGPRFMRELYYKPLVADGLVRCIIARADGRIVGFLSYTDDPYRFMTRGIRRHFGGLSWVLAREAFARPALLAEALVAARIIIERRAVPARSVEGVGEALSMAIEREYTRWVPPGGESRLAIRFFDTMAADLAESGCQSLELNVDPARLAPNLFYSSLGCTLKRTVIAGRVVHRYGYDLKRSRAAGGRAAT